MVYSHVMSPFVGREPELDMLIGAVSAGGSLVVVRGPAGIGKTRLIDEVRGHVRRAGGVVARGRCTERGRSIPLRPIADLLLAAARDGWQVPSSLAAYRPVLARFVPDWGEAGDVDSVLVLGEAVLRLAAAQNTAGRCTVIELEDVQWADTETVTCLEYVADAVPSVPVTIIVTLRDGVEGPGLELVDHLASGRQCTTLRVGRLDAASIEEIACASLDAPRLPDDVLQRLCDRSDGIPLFVEELLSQATTAEQLAVVPPDSIRTAVMARVAGLDEDAARFIRCSALLGRAFPWKVVIDAAAIAPDRVNDVLRAATGAQLLDVDGAEVRFRHALTRDAVLADVLPTELADMSRWLLAALDRHTPNLPGDLVIAAAELAGLAGDHARAAAHWCDAAGRARIDGAVGLAVELAQRGWVAQPTEQSARMLVECLAENGRFDEAVEVGRSVADVSGSPPPELQLAIAASAVRAERWDEAAAALVALRSVATGIEGRVELLDALVALGTDDPDRALGLARRAAGATDADTRCEALMAIGRVERLRDLVVAERAFRDAAELAVSAGRRATHIRALQELGTIDMYVTGDSQRLLAARRAAEQAGAVTTLATVDLQLGALAGERGELGASIEAARRSQDSAVRFGLPVLAMAFALEATAHAKLGAHDAFVSAAARARETGRDRSSVELLLVGNAEASYHLHRGELGEALDALREAVALQLRSPLGGTPFAGLAPLLATHLGTDDAAALRSTLAGLEHDTPMSKAMTQAANAIVAGDDGDDALARAHYGAVDTQLRRYHGHYRLHLTQLLVAPRAHIAGWGEPEMWLREALAGFERLGLDGLATVCRNALRNIGAPVPRRRDARIVVPSELAALGITAREFEVLQLVTEGLGNRAIADRLFLSARTVEKHVERLTVKTGRSRHDLSALLDT